MRYLTAFHTDVGTRKHTNQDSMLLMQATTLEGEILFAVVCDGMGGLKKGELASAEVVRAMATWFRERLPLLLQSGFTPEKLKNDWMQIVDEQEDRITRYGAVNGLRLGTTLVAIFFIWDQYYIINVGDSRIYQIEPDRLLQLTHDHTVVQREVDMGRLTPEEAERDPRRSVLLQCIGASSYLQPDFVGGQILPDQVYLLCCDGFRHVPSAAEFCSQMNVRMLLDEPGMTDTLVRMTESIKSRGEQDNISAILIRTCN